MLRDDTQGEREASYACQPGHSNRWAQCQTPRLHALRAEGLLVRTALRTVLTEENISRVLAVANDPQRYDTACERSLTRRDVQELGEDPERLVLASGRAAESWEFPPEHRPQSLVLYRAMNRELTRPGCLSQAS